MWANETIKINSLYQIPKYVALHQTRNSHGGGICFFIRKGINFKIGEDLSRNFLQKLKIRALKT